MKESKSSNLQVRQLLLSTVVGAMISSASTIAFMNSERKMWMIANIAVSTVSLAVIPGYILSAYFSGNIHNANLILAGAVNFIIYSSLVLLLIVRRSRKSPKLWKSGTKSEKPRTDGTFSDP
jgi:hypothetical protein